MGKEINSINQIPCFRVSSFFGGLLVISGEGERMTLTNFVIYILVFEILEDLFVRLFCIGDQSRQKNDCHSLNIREKVLNLFMTRPVQKKDGRNTVLSPSL